MTTKVVFRKWRPSDRIANGGGDVIALFPQIPSDPHGAFCLSYEHIGQHGGAFYPGVIAATLPAGREEYTDLKAELEAIGYDLEIRRRAGWKDHLARRTAAQAAVTPLPA